jgi:hypothetical protein
MKSDVMIFIMKIVVQVQRLLVMWTDIKPISCPLPNLLWDKVERCTPS